MKDKDNIIQSGKQKRQMKNTQDRRDKKNPGGPTSI